MAGHTIPHFHNDDGHTMIEIGVRESMRIGALPPFDHPHVFLDMGDDDGRSVRTVRHSTASMPG